LTIDGQGNGEVFIVGEDVAATIQELTITGGFGYVVGGISNYGDLTLDRVAVEGNSGTNGGGIRSAGGSLSILRSTIADNESVYAGGGVVVESGTASIVNSTISGNTASTGGGVHNYATLTVTNSTITNNDGGGIYSDGTTTVHNTIIAGNENNYDVSGAFDTASSYNLIGAIDGSTGLSSGTGTIYGTASSPEDAGLAPLSNFGGLTRTHALLTASAALDAGNPSTSGLPASDQRGSTRVVDGDGTAGARVDIGAFEAGVLAVVVNTLVDENGDYFTGNRSLREALGLSAALAGLESINFGGLTGTINLNSGLVIESDVTISGTGADVLTINGQGSDTVLTIESGAAVSIYGLTITGGDGYNAGGIYSLGDLWLEQVAVEGNNGNNAGGIYQSGGSLTVVSSTIAGNSSDNSGGGVFLDGTDALVINSTISGNTGDTGGGIEIDGGTVEIVNATIANNTGGGISTYAATVTVHNTIVAGNASNNDVSGTFQSASSYNLIGAHNGSTGLVGGVGTIYGNTTSPQAAGLSGLYYNGGPTKTHALDSGSAAINAGNNEIWESYGFVGTGGGSDQRGFPRYDDGLNEEIEDLTIDIGAYEVAFGEFFG
jgi:hypothetical protein